MHWRYPRWLVPCGWDNQYINRCVDWPAADLRNCESPGTAGVQLWEAAAHCTQGRVYVPGFLNTWRSYIQGSLAFIEDSCKREEEKKEADKTASTHAAVLKLKSVDISDAAYREEGLKRANLSSSGSTCLNSSTETGKSLSLWVRG